MKKKIVALVIVILVGLIGFQLYRKNIMIVEDKHLILYGNIDIRDVVLSFRVPGRIAEVRFEEGDQVNKDDIVAILDQDTYLEDLAMANAELAEAKAAFTNAESTYKRRASLVKTGAVSESLYDDSLAARDQAKARVQTAKARVNRYETALKDTEIKAPSTGIILTRVREPGSIIQVGQPVYTLTLNDPVWARTYIAEPDLGRIYPGQPSTITTDSGRKYAGQIGFISPQAEFTPKNVETTQLRTDLVYRLRVIVNNPDHSLRQGMPVTVNINTPQKPTEPRGSNDN